MSLFVIVSLVAAQVAAAPAVEAAPSKPKAEKKICKIDELDTGSRMKKRICLTQVEWEKRNAGRSAGDLKTIGGR